MNCIFLKKHKNVTTTKTFKDKKKLFLPGIEPGTLRVLDSRDNHYTTRTAQ